MAQEDYLASKRDDFACAQKNKTMHEFWVIVNKGFFALWGSQASEVEPEPEVGKKKRKLLTSTFASEKEWIEDQKVVSIDPPLNFHVYETHLNFPENPQLVS